MDERKKSLQFTIIEELERKTLKNRHGVISFRQVHSVLESVYYYNRQASEEVLHELEKQGFIRLIPYQGIEIIHPPNNSSVRNLKTALHVDLEK